MGATADDKDALPAWLDRPLVAAAWKNGCPEVDADSVQIRTVSKVGGGMLSETFRVVAVDRGGAEKSFFVKSVPDLEGPMKDFIESGVFYREKIAFTTALSVIDESLKRVEGDAWRPTAPLFYYLGKQPVEFLVLEDLIASGFNSFESRRPLDLDHAMAAMKGIGRLHAASLLLINDEMYEKQIFRENLLFNQRFRDSKIESFGQAVSLAVNALEEHPWFRPCKSRFEAMGANLLDIAVRAVCEETAPIKVLLHGDCHCGNMMFRGTGEELEVRFYDFQGLHVGSPAEDLQYFFHMSLRLEVLRDHADLLVQHYHDTFISTLRALGLQDIADRCPLEVLTKELDRLQTIGAFCTYFIFPTILVLTDRNFDIDMAAVTRDAKEGEKIVAEAYRDPGILKYLEFLTLKFDQKGVFDL